MAKGKGLLGFWGAWSMGVGGMIGGGIFSTLGVVVAASLVSGYLLQTRTDAAYPYIDSMTTWAAIWATFLVARKVLENWWYWLVIDTASIFIYWSRDLEQTALLFVVYVVMIPFGIVSWTRSYREAAQWA